MKKTLLLYKGEVEKMDSEYSRIVFNDDGEYKDIYILTSNLKKINADYNGATVNINIVKSDRLPKWSKKPERKFVKIVEELKSISQK
jgi:hypothetical protein